MARMGINAPQGWDDNAIWFGKVSALAYHPDGNRLAASDGYVTRVREFLPDADRLKVHTKHSGNAWSGRAVVTQPVNLIQNRCDFQLVIRSGANHAHRIIQSIDVRNFWRVKILHAFA